MAADPMAAAASELEGMVEEVGKHGGAGKEGRVG